MTGASQNTKALQAHANNLANVTTSGFRRDFEQARSMPVFGDGLPARAYAMTERPGTDFTPGSLQETGNDLDIAVKGDAWIAVQAPDGAEAYVRTASMTIDALGVLRTATGLPVMGNAGPIAVPPEQKVEIGQDGTISIRALGEALRDHDRSVLFRAIVGPFDHLGGAFAGVDEGDRRDLERHRGGFRGVVGSAAGQEQAGGEQHGGKRTHLHPAQATVGPSLAPNGGHGR